MNDNRISPKPTAAVRPEPIPYRPSIRARVTARIRSRRLDAMLAVGAPTPPGSAIAARAARLTSTSEREAIARALRRCVHEAANDTIVWSSRIPLHRKNIAASAGTIDIIALRLHAPLPVDARGMARLTRVLNDGLGPMYAFGHGDLDGRLRAALAAL
ncbi:hypothetical protein AWB98_22085 [Mycolicibacterium conceptionense]|uniref:Uncharacterized protein n=1 Tax=Mycolicibacterium conceptionense TaxID=451644 RepID=A0ABX3V3U9_9MYCO|nr:hypothetical protein [Mycolicibacterium conceptionense]ORV24178.1 hypothetical protein AWB98_22085 [Mycolicibacterium conceptionense]